MRCGVDCETGTVHGDEPGKQHLGFEPTSWARVFDGSIRVCKMTSEG